MEAFEKLFTFNDSAEAIIFAAILLITFLLGLLLWALLAHWPQRRRLKKDIKLLDGELKTLTENHKQLEEKYSVQAAKVQRLEEDLTAKELHIEELQTKLTQIQDLYTHLETERDEKVKDAQAAEDERNELQKLYKYAQIEIVEANNKEAEALKNSKTALEKVEMMKGLMEELEQDRQKMQDAKEAAFIELGTAKTLLEQAHAEKEELRTDLGVALNKITLLEELNPEELAKENMSLKDELAQLELDFKQLQHDKSAIAQKLEHYTSIETQAQQEEAEEENLMDQLLDEARNALSHQGLYQNIDQEELIEDPELLQERLAELEAPQTRGLEEIEEAAMPELEEDEIELMDRALAKADEAMGLQGFFQEIEEAILVVNEEPLLDDEELMLRSLEEAEDWMQETPFLSNIKEEDLIENPELLEEQLNQEPEVSARGLDMEEPEVIEWDEEEELLMFRALESANLAMNSEGLYTSINPAKLLEVQEDNTVDEKEVVVDPKYKTALEQYVVAELGQSIPKSNEMNKDDLKKINGIGTFIEEKLNYLGFYQYEQIAALGDEEYRKKLTAVLGLAENTIEHDQWVTQAKELVTKRKISDLTKDINISKLFKK